jgi:hypothetical protein
MKIAAVFLSASLMLAGGAQAQELPTLRSVIEGSKEAAIFQKMLGTVAPPDWLKENSVESPGEKVRMGGKDYSVFTACKAHDCPSEQIAILYGAADSAMYGVIRSADAVTSVEKLTWLNIGGGEESIDGKAILYAALTGSLSNHPDAFNF